MFALLFAALVAAPSAEGVEVSEAFCGFVVTSDGPGAPCPARTSRRALSIDS
jgi:hypothetical protein